MRGATEMVEIIEHHEQKRKAEDKPADPVIVDDLTKLIAAIREAKSDDAIRMLAADPALRSSRPGAQLLAPTPLDRGLGQPHVPEE